MDKITEVVQGMWKAIEMTLGENISEVMQEHIRIRILEDRIIEVDTEEIIGMKFFIELGVGLGKGHIQVISEGMTGIVVRVGQGQDQEWVLIETELGVVSVGNMVILWKIVGQPKKKERWI